MSSFKVVSGVPVVAAPDEIDVTNAEKLRSDLLMAASYGHGTLAVDMTATRFCDSCGPNRTDGRPLYVRGQRNMTVHSATR